jgi:hypothetical protein
MLLSIRQAFDVNTLLSPGLAKTIERTSVEPDPILYPMDIFKANVNSSLNQFGDILRGCATEAIE